MIVYLANKTQFREDILFNRIEETVHESFQGANKLTGTLKKSRISNLFVGSGAFTATFDQLRKYVASGHRDGETITSLAA